MGAYLSQPITTKDSSDHEGSKLSCGASSMQGWRIYQEDAHNVIIDFDENKSLFAVYDGHGGSEVALYTSQHLPDFIKNTAEFKKGNYKQALIDAFMEFDESLIKEEVMAVLKTLKEQNEGDDSYPATDEDAPEDDDDENVSNLYEEATMPLSEVISRYRNPAMQRCKEGGKPMSPRLKSKDKKSNLAAGEGSSSAGGSGSSSAEVAGSSSSPSKAEAECSSSLKPSADVKPESSSSVEVTPSDKSEPSATDVCSSSSETAVKPEDRKPETSNGADVTTSSAKNGSGSVDAKENGSEAVETEENGEKEEDGVISSSEVKKPFKGKAKDKPAAPLTNGADVDSSTGAVTNGAAKKQRTSPRKLGTKNLLESTLEDDSSESDEDFKVDDEESSDDDDDEVNNSHLPDDEEDSDSDEDGEEELGEEEESDEDDSDFDGEGAEGLSREDIQKRMKEALEHKDVPGMDSGCTAVVVLIVDNQVYIANAGDSRAVLCRDALAKDLSEDHKPEDEKEKERIVKAGGEVTPDGRVNGGLNLSRALGDHSYKQTASLPLADQMITARPDVECLTLSPADEFIVIACDGIWNSLSSQEVVDFVRGRLLAQPPETKLSSICEELFDKCLAPDSSGDGTGCDNMTCVLVKLSPSATNGPTATVAAAKRSRDSDVSADNTTSSTPVESSDPPAKKTRVESAPSSDPAESAPDSSSVSEVEMKETSPAAAP